MPRRCEVRWLLCLTAVLLCLSGVSSYEETNLRALLKVVSCASEAAQKHCIPAEQDPGWRFSCPSGFTPCGGRCYARLQIAVEYGQAEKDCAAIGAHLAVPRSRDQNLCVAGLAGYQGVWLGITDRDEEGVFQGADGGPILPNEGHVWAIGQPDNDAHRGNEDCVEIRKVEGKYTFAVWNDWKCSGVRNIPMCQLK